MPSRVRRATLVRTTLAAATLALPLIAGSAAAPALAGGGPVTWRYPSVDCPRVEGLQGCVDTVVAGDTILLVDEVINENVSIHKSLTLKPDGPGFKPQLRTIFVADDVSPGASQPGSQVDLTVHLSDLRATRSVRGLFQYGSGDVVTLDGLVVGKDSAQAKGIDFFASAPARVEVRRTFARTLERQEDSLSFYADDAGGEMTFIAIGNELTQTGSTDGGSGIAITGFTGVALTARVYANVIHDVAESNAGGASGIFLYVSGQSTADVDIVGNTIDSVRSAGIGLRNNIESPGHLTLDVFGNVASHTGARGMNLDSSSGAITLRQGYNALFANGSASRFNGQQPGPGTIKGDPQYVAPGSNDFRLRSDSPLIDAGRACTPGGLSRTDKAGRARWAGREVDIGAYERGAGPANGVVRVGGPGSDTLGGTSGRDILCGLAGTDKLTGKGGPDYLDGGGANDTICAKDGVSGNDIAIGGPGTDAGRRDPGDVARSVETAASC